jgi:Cu/Ag efflux protein CusF
MKSATIAAALAAAMLAAAQPAWAQDAMASAAQDIVSAVQPVHLKATIVGIDPGSRALTLKGAGGNVVVVLVGQQVAGFEKLRVGDRVDALYKNALLVKADRVDGKGKGIRERVDTQVYAPASGGFESARQVEVLATVQKIDRKRRLVTLRGAYQTQTLEAAPQVDLTGVKVGDTIHAVFVSAAAVEVTPQDTQ